MSKRIILFILILIIFVSFAWVQTITVKSPLSGDIWYKGQTYTIKWDKSGNMNSKVKIRLYQGGTKILGVTDNTENDGSFSWTIPANLNDGTYYIRVKTIDNLVYDDSEKFTIKKYSAPTLKVVSPGSGVTWTAENSYEITWVKSGDMNSHLKITLYKSDSVTLQNIIVDSTLNDGKFRWTIPSGISTGSYLIKLETIDKAVSGKSGVFRIESTPSPSIFVKKPTKGEKLEKGSTYTIEWEKRGGMDHFVGIWLCKNRAYLIEIIFRTENDGVFRWEIPKSLISGTYYIKIKTVDGKVSGESEPFYIIGTDQKPDLEVKGIRLNGMPDKNIVNSFNISVKNNGDDFSGYVDYRVIGMDKFLSGGKYAFDRKGKTRLKLARGETGTKTLFRGFSWPPDICKVTYSVTLDPLKKIYDLNRKNNTFSRTFYKGEILGKKYCNIRIIPRMIKIGKANLRAVPSGGSIVLSDNKFDIFFTLRNNCSEDKAWDFYIIYDFNPLTARGENKVIWHSNIRLKSCEVKPLRITGLKIPTKKEFKILALRILESFGKQKGYSTIYQVRVKVNK